MKSPARWALLAASLAIAGIVWLPGHAAPPAEEVPAAERITFEQYRDWRLHFIEERQTQLAARLAAATLTAAEKTRLEQQKAYYDWYAGMSAEERDRRFRARFDQIDANHDGVIDPPERAAWHDRQHAYYERRDARRQAAAREPARP
jgi:hypothetical protein